MLDFLQIQKYCNIRLYRKDVFVFRGRGKTAKTRWAEAHRRGCLLGTRIKELRKEFGLSQVELAAQMEVTKQTISNWENENIQPSIDMLVGLANVFNVTTDYLLGLDDVPRLSIEGLPLSFAAHLSQIIEDFRSLT